MSLKIPSWSSIIAVFLVATVFSHNLAQAIVPTGQESPLRVDEPLEAVIADLEQAIPEILRREQVPGAAIALIREGEIVWVEGFGVKNRLTGEPVSPQTVFEVASNSKVVTAYLALRLVDQGQLALDEPLNSYLPEPWLPPSPYRETITLRHVLSHSAGLRHNTASRESLFAPGEGYSYSAIGYQYLQAVIEQVTGRPLEAVARELVFEPLGMPASSFVNRPDLTAATANGHLRALLPVLLFAIFFAIALLIAGLVALIIQRLRTGRWRLVRRAIVACLVVAFGLSLLPGFILLGLSGPLEFAWLVALVGLAVVIVFAAVFTAGRVIIRRLVPRHSRWQVALSVAWGLVVVAAILFLSSRIINLPLPKWPAVPAQASGSMRAPAGDMAAFLMELAAPRHLSPELATQLRTGQISLSPDLSWGLGPGIMHSRQGDALWQWGQHIDFQSVMVIYPEHGFGVVVLTNNDLLNPDVAINIAHRALGGQIEPIHQASHLAFNYRPEE